MSHFVSDSCKSERCQVCKAPSTHKVGEEIPHDDPNPIRHNFTAYLCCKHFILIFGVSGHDESTSTPLCYQLGKEELAKLEVWLEDHNKTCSLAKVENQGAIGGRLTYYFTETGLGVVVKVLCACGASCDLSDYDSW